MRRLCAVLLGGVLALAAVGGAFAAETAAAARVEARSAHFFAVGLVRGDTMDIHLSRLLDNAPVPNAVVAVTFRGKTYATMAALDGGYSFKAQALRLPGSAAVAFKVAYAGGDESLDGTMQIPAQAGANEDSGKGGLRQLLWWVLNFAVCIGFLWLIAKRRKKTDA